MWHTQNVIMPLYSYSMSHLFLQTLTVVILVLPKMVNWWVQSVHSTPAKQPTCVVQATHSRDRAVEPASLMEIGVGVYLSALVRWKEINFYVYWQYKMKLCMAAPVMCHMTMQDTKPTHLWIWAFVIAGFVGVYYIEEAVSSDKNSDNRVRSASLPGLPNSL